MCLATNFTVSDPPRDSALEGYCFCFISFFRGESSFQLAYALGDSTARLCASKEVGDILGYATTENHITWKAAREELGGERTIVLVNPIQVSEQAIGQRNSLSKGKSGAWDRSYWEGICEVFGRSYYKEILQLGFRAVMPVLGISRYAVSCVPPVLESDPGRPVDGKSSLTQPYCSIVLIDVNIKACLSAPCVPGIPPFLWRTTGTHYSRSNWCLWFGSASPILPLKAIEPSLSAYSKMRVPKRKMTKAKWRNGDACS